MPDRGRSGDAWTRYWLAGHGESFAPESGTGFDPTALWHEYFAAFPNGAKLLDLATGGGYVVRLAIAAGTSSNRTYEIHGVDLADIAGLRPRLGPSGQCTLHLQGNVNLNALPFGDAVFDGATSQFGIEYADRNAAAMEAVRVLKPAGRSLFLMHHAGSAIVKAAAARLRAHRRVIPDDLVFRRGEWMFAQFARGVPPALAVADVAYFRAAVATVMQRLALEGLLSNTQEVVSFLADVAHAPERYDPRDAMQRLRFVEEDVAGWIMRQQALIDSALDDEGVKDFARMLAAAGAKARTPELFRSSSGDLLAWKLTFQKRPQTPC